MKVFGVCVCVCILVLKGEIYGTNKRNIDNERGLGFGCTIAIGPG